MAWAGTVTVTTPTTGSMDTSPVHIHATYSGTATYMKLFLDGAPSTVQSNTSTFDVSMAMAAGPHRIVVQAADATTGTVFSSTPVNITVTTGGGNTITVSPASATVIEGMTQQFTATDSGGLAVTWAASCGTISSSGLFTAPNTTGACTITASDSTGAHGTATATIQAPGGNTITVSPASPTVIEGMTQQFTATDSGGLAVTWAASCGTISSSGLFTAPNTTGTCTITASDSTGAQGTATATIQAPGSPVTFITPLANATVKSPVHVRFTYSGTASYMKLWVDGVAQPAQHDPHVYDTTISLGNGVHRLQGQGHDATSGVTFTTTESITVNGPGTGVIVTPSTATTQVGGTQQFTANVSVTWSASCGTINSSGLFTAPNTPGTCTITATATDGSGATGTAIDTVVNVPPASGNYTTWKNDNMRTGQQRNEAKLTPANVNSTTFGIKFSESVDAAVYAQPLYMSGLTVNGATHNVVFVATENDSVYAFDADNAGPFLWKKNLLMGGVPVPQAPVGSTIFGGIGITSTPVIDPNSNTIYVVTESLENGTNYIFRLHALDVTTGNEKFGGHVLISDPAFQPMEQLQRSALLLANGNVYIAFASQGDHKPWHGWLFAYAAGSLSKVTAYNVTSTGSAGGIWGGGNAVAADANGDIFVATGNGDWNGTTNLSMSFIRLSPNLSVLDFFSPFDEASLSGIDDDLGAGGILLVPNQSGSHPHIVIGCGKPTSIYVVDRDNMGHLHPGVDSQIIQELPNVIGGTSGIQPTAHCFMSPAYWQGNLYFIGNNDVIKAFKLNGSTGKLTTTPTSKGSFVFDFPGGQTVVSSNGSTNGVVWAMDHTSNGTSVKLHAFDATNVARTLFTSPNLGSGTKWSTPTVINGEVFVGTNGKLYVFSLK